MSVLIIVCCVVVFIVLVYFISVSNKINRTIVKVDEAKSGIDVALTKRYDTLTKMIDVVKGFAKHESELILETINLRKDMSLKEMNEENKKISANISKINAVAEAYPELKSSENYNTLQKSIADVEEHLQAARRLYNSNASILNQMIVSFPASIVANSKGVKKVDFFEAEDAKKEDVKIDL